MKTTPLQHPDFMIIGAGKSATTALAKYLDQHPDIFMSPVKEPNFFAVEGQTPVDPKDDPELLYHYPQAVYNAEAYEQLYRKAKAGMKTGEASTMYLYKPGAAERIKKYKPDVKMIAVLRNPAERLYSRYLHLARVNKLPDKNLENMFDKNSVWWRRHDLLFEGFYYSHLKQFYELFNKEQIKVFLYEDMNTNGEELLQQVYGFIGVRTDFSPQTGIRYNRSGFVKNRLVDAFIGDNSIIRRSLEKVTPSIVHALRRSTFFQKTVNSMRNKNLERPELDKALKQRMIGQIYKKDIIKLQDLIQRDLSHWLNP
ncbi:MAG: sulfotransferase domain-containing protein [Bacteroidales bacterium]